MTFDGAPKRFKVASITRTKSTTSSLFSVFPRSPSLSLSATEETATRTGSNFSGVVNHGQVSLQSLYGYQVGGLLKSFQVDQPVHGVAEEKIYKKENRQDNKKEWE
jgi:hypothetical protein